MNALLLWLHIISSVGALVVGVGIPMQLVVERQNRDSDVVAVASRLLPGLRIYVITLVVAGVLGFGLVSTTDDVSWSDPWIWLGIVGWLAANGLLHAGLAPAIRGLAAGQEAEEDRARMFGAITAVIVAIVLVLMLVQPG